MAVTYRPAILSSTIAILLGVLVVGFLAETNAVWDVLSIFAVGLLAVAGGLTFRAHRDSDIGGVVAVIGVVVTVIAFADFVSHGHSLRTITLVISGMIGTVLLTIGLFPIYGSGSRVLVKLGAAFLFVGVLFAGYYPFDLTMLLMAGVGTILAWDAGENAINIGTHLGVTTETKILEITHIAGSAFVGIVAVIIGQLVVGMGPSDFTLSQFILLIVGLFLLILALHD